MTQYFNTQIQIITYFLHFVFLQLHKLHQTSLSKYSKLISEKYSCLPMSRLQYTHFVLTLHAGLLLQVVLRTVLENKHIG